MFEMEDKIRRMRELASLLSRPDRLITRKAGKS